MRRVTLWTCSKLMLVFMWHVCRSWVINHNFQKIRILHYINQSCSGVSKREVFRIDPKLSWQTLPTWDWRNLAQVPVDVNRFRKYLLGRCILTSPSDTLLHSSYKTRPSSNPSGFQGTDCQNSYKNAHIIESIFTLSTGHEPPRGNPHHDRPIIPSLT